MWVWSTLEWVPWYAVTCKQDTREAAVRKASKGHGWDTIVSQPLWSLAYFQEGWRLSGRDSKQQSCFLKPS